MKTIKKYVKGIIPTEVLELYRTAMLLPRYLHALNCDRNVGMKPVSFYTDQQTVDKIINDRMSLSRFGDGEFRWMLEIREKSFQEVSGELKQALVDAFRNTHPNLLIGIPVGLFYAEGCKLGTKIWWKIVKWETFSRIAEHVDYSKKYANASITRPYIDYKDAEKSRKDFENMRRIWDGRNCIFVEGENTKLGVGNDLFDNAKSIGRIICPAENAFAKLEEIKTAIREYVSKDSLILGALGPTASILAAQMCEEGYQFVDIGHIDIEYTWLLKKARTRVPVAGKYVNECDTIIPPENIEDEAYKKSVLTVIM